MWVLVPCGPHPVFGIGYLVRLQDSAERPWEGCSPLWCGLRHPSVCLPHSSSGHFFLCTKCLFQNNFCFTSLSFLWRGFWDEPIPFLKNLTFKNRIYILKLNLETLEIGIMSKTKFFFQTRIRTEKLSIFKFFHYLLGFKFNLNLIKV